MSAAGIGLSGVARCRPQGYGGDTARTQRGQEVLEATEISYVTRGRCRGSDDNASGDSSFGLTSVRYCQW